MSIEQLWKDFYSPLRGFVAKRVKDPEDVEDIIQQVFLKIAAGISGLQQTQLIRSWIYQITRNCIIDYYRKRRPTEELPAEILDPNRSQETNQSAELAACIKPMVLQLPEKYRQAVDLAELQGLTQREVGQRLGLSVSGAKSRVQRGRQKLKEMLLDCCAIETDRYGNIIDFQNTQGSDSDWSSHQNGCGCG